jgi:hypothetical protein
MPDNVTIEALQNTVVVLAPDVSLRKNRFLFRTAYLNIDATFLVSEVPPGNYKLFAFANAPRGASYNPDFVAAFESSGRPVRVLSGQNQSVEATLIRQ